MRLLKPKCEITTQETSLGTIPTLVNKTGDWRYTTPVRREKISPCTAACPLQSNIAEWVENVHDGDMQSAWQLLSKTNPFPAITGYVCYHFCESKCNRQFYDEAIAIRELEKRVGMWRHQEYSNSNNNELMPKNRRTHKIAIIGSGPSGLACAYYLTQLGLKVTVFERDNEPGGMLVWGIPSSRLPRQPVETEIMMLKALGIEFQCKTEIGRDLDFESLHMDFDAIYVATGAGVEKRLNIPGDNLNGVLGALTYLRAVYQGENIPAFSKVLVIGGGNTAVDAAIVARESGADVSIVYRRSRNDMPAHPEEVAAAENVGVRFVFNANPREIVGVSHISSLILQHTTSSHRNEEITIIGEDNFSLDCDLLLVATGQKNGIESLPAAVANAIDNVGKTFAGGDLMTGPANVPSAIAAGREGARAIAHHLQIGQLVINQVLALPLSLQTPVVEYQDVHPDCFTKQKRAEDLQAEAARCFSCGHCNRCGMCWMFCPDMAVEIAEKDFTFLLDYCKGCGICVKECPGSVLKMEVGSDET